MTKDTYSRYPGTVMPPAGRGNGLNAREKRPYSASNYSAYKPKNYRSPSHSRKWEARVDGLQVSAGRIKHFAPVLKGLNQLIEYHHFKMDTLWSAVRSMTPGCFMASVDLKDAYYIVPILYNSIKDSSYFTGRENIFNTLICLMA